MDLSEFEEVSWNQPFDIGSKCLESQKKQVEAKLSQGVNKTSFVEKVRGDEQPRHVEIADLSNPVMKGNIPSIRLPKQTVERGQQFWDYECVMSIAKGVGCPIGVDKVTAERELGFYANVLIDLDLSKSLPNQILVEVDDGEEFLQEIAYPALPKFCPHCQAIGHSKNECKGLQREIHEVDPQSNMNTYQEPWKLKKLKNGVRREEEAVILGSKQQSLEQCNSSETSSRVQKTQYQFKTHFWRSHERIGMPVLNAWLLL
ncbi:hypothetical protein FRX31_004300 [Thalictrum thalictroides]|uniref:Uncharacterized protein n=1 Tax=Thalictrum thalictroides TaxID=46969 RepID=A0A7J6XBA3_THATH|nr:hypothetical protein FRX31_004300 [Thalictrum thalictroides]